MTPDGDNSAVLIYPKMQEPAKRWEPFAPMSVMAVAAPLLRNGYSTTIIDSNVENDYISVLDKISTPPICFGISTMLGYQLVDALEWTKLINKKFPNTPVVWGGWFPTIVPEETLKAQGVSAVIRGQGEESFLAYVQALQNGDDTPNLPDVITRKGTEIIDGGRRPAIDPNAYPMAPYHLLDIERYAKIKRGTINYTSSYGCPNMCQFCSIHMLKQRRVHKGLTPERVVEDLKVLHKEYGARVVEFHEDEFLHDRHRCSGIFEEILKNNLEINLVINGRANDILKYEPEQLKLLKRAGTAVVGVGVESGSPSTLKRIRKGITPEQVIEVAHRFKEHGIPARMNFMNGHHLETPSELKETFLLIEKLKRINPSLSFILFFYTPIPGSLFFNEEVKMGNIVKPATMEEWSYYWSGNLSPWFGKEEKRFFKQNRDSYRIMSFYGALSNLDSFFPLLVNRPGGKYIKALLALGARIRFQTDFYRFPLLWHAAKVLKRITS